METNSQPPARVAADRQGEHAIHRLLTPVIYDDLRAHARRLLRRGSISHSIDATDLVNEVVLRLIRALGINLSDPNHLIALAKRGMRQWMIEHARRRDAQKRGGSQAPSPLIEVIAAPCQAQSINCEIDHAIDRLVDHGERLARVASLHLRHEIPLDQIAVCEGISRKTVFEDWAKARALLIAELRDEPYPPPHTHRPDESCAAAILGTQFLRLPHKMRFTTESLDPPVVGGNTGITEVAQRCWIRTKKLSPCSPCSPWFILIGAPNEKPRHFHAGASWVYLN